jgi:hypothetical protein
MKIVNINQCLSLTNENFSDQQYNIDYLAQKLHEDINLEEKLSIANKCINLCEKFHSYFHFEESYFRLLLAKNLDNQELYIKELEAAIFQDPLNYEAKSLLLEVLSPDDERLNDHRYIGKVNDKKYERDFENYSQFLTFAIGESAVIHESPKESYWYNFSRYQETAELVLLQSTVEIISCNHKLYHCQAAKLYYNRSKIFSSMNCDTLAKNDLIKAKNLDISIEK